LNWESYYNIIENKNIYKYEGYVKKVVGLTIESRGPEINIGNLCEINTINKNIMAEVVGFNESNLLLMPLGEMSGIGVGNPVYSNGEVIRISVSDDLIGRMVDGLGNPIDGGSPIRSKHYYPLDQDSPAPLDRKEIDEVLPLGIKAIDGLLTIGKGQRVGIFAGSGVGKSTLIGMIARNTNADINVVALIGERGREVKDFVRKDLGEEGLNKSVIVAATSDQPALVRLKAAYTATAIAEYFRDQGKNVLLMMDSLTRFAMAQREIGLAIGEPPVSRGYTPSVFGVLPRLLERPGNTKKGSITGIYTVLVDGDDMNEPITDAARGILDGHIILSRKIANKGQFPAIDILGSVSRVMGDIVDDNHKKDSMKFRETLATYRESEDLINIGAYVKGSNPKIDYSVKCIDKILEFMKQEVDESFDFNQTLNELKRVIL
jgi:flagellum-specific ATP synthase